MSLYSTLNTHVHISSSAHIITKQPITQKNVIYKLKMKKGRVYLIVKSHSIFLISLHGVKVYIEEEAIFFDGKISLISLRRIEVYQRRLKL